jgi:hypothetical protein
MFVDFEPAAHHGMPAQVLLCLPVEAGPEPVTAAGFPTLHPEPAGMRMVLPRLSQQKALKPDIMGPVRLSARLEQVRYAIAERDGKISIIGEKPG